VPHPQPRVAARVAVGRRPAEPLDQEQAKSFLRPLQVVARVERAEDVVGGDLFVEVRDQAREAVLADRRVHILFGRGHLCDLRSQIPGGMSIAADQSAVAPIGARLPNFSTSSS
jgi:hypothetical protein